MVSTQKKEGGQLSEIQISLLRLFDQNMSESETLEVRKMLLAYFDKGLQSELNSVLEKKKIFSIRLQQNVV